MIKVTAVKPAKWKLKAPLKLIASTETCCQRAGIVTRRVIVVAAQRANFERKENEKMAPDNDMSLRWTRVDPTRWIGTQTSKHAPSAGESRQDGAKGRVEANTLPDSDLFESVSLNSAAALGRLNIDCVDKIVACLALKDRRHLAQTCRQFRVCAPSWRVIPLPGPESVTIRDVDACFDEKVRGRGPDVLYLQNDLCSFLPREPSGLLNVEIRLSYDTSSAGWASTDHRHTWTNLIKAGHRISLWDQQWGYDSNPYQSIGL